MSCMCNLIDETAKHGPQLGLLWPNGNCVEGDPAIQSRPSSDHPGISHPDLLGDSVAAHWCLARDDSWLGEHCFLPLSKAKLFDFALGQSCNPHISQQWFQLRSEVRFCHFPNELKLCLGSDLDSKEKRKKNPKNQTKKRVIMECRGRGRGAKKRKKK